MLAKTTRNRHSLSTQEGLLKKSFTTYRVNLTLGLASSRKPLKSSLKVNIRIILMDSIKEASIHSTSIILKGYLLQADLTLYSWKITQSYYISREPLVMVSLKVTTSLLGLLSSNHSPKLLRMQDSLHACHLFFNLCLPSPHHKKATMKLNRECLTIKRQNNDTS